MSDEQSRVAIELEHLKRVRLEPGDVLVVQHPADIPPDDAWKMGDYLSSKFPGHECVVLTGGAQLAVVHPAAGKATL